MPSASGLALVGLDRVAGTFVHLDRSPVVIGRDQRECTLVLPDDMTAVSRRHCTLLAQEEGLSLVDDGSTNGTFLAGGRRVDAGHAVAVSPGMEFYLGDPAVRFRVVRDP